MWKLSRWHYEQESTEDLIDQVFDLKAAAVHWWGWIVVFPLGDMRKCGIFRCPMGCASYIQYVEASSAAEEPPMHKAAFLNKELSGPN